MQTLFKLLLYLSYFSVLGPILLALNALKHSDSVILRLLTLLLLSCASLDLTGYLLAKAGISNLPVINSYFYLQFIILSLIYANLLKSNKRVIGIISIIYSVFFILNSIYIQGIHVIQSYTSTLAATILIVYAFLYYGKLISVLPVHDLTKYLPFWINSAVTYYFVFNLILFAYSTYIFTHYNDEQIITLWSFHNANNIIKNIFFAVGVYYAATKE